MHFDGKSRNNTDVDFAREWQNRPLYIDFIFLNRNDLNSWENP